MENWVYDKIGQVLNIFETGKKGGDYANITILEDGYFPDGTRGMRQITYGAKQTTEQSNLATLLKMYVEAKGLYAIEFEPYMPMVGNISLVDKIEFIDLLKKAGTDPIMKTTQDEFFNEVYMKPAQKCSKKMVLRYPQYGSHF